MGPHEPRLSMGTAESRRSSFQERADEVSEEEYIAKTREALAQAEANLVLAIESAERVAKELEAEELEAQNIEAEAAASLLSLRAELAEVESEHRSFTHKRLPPWIAVFDSRMGKVYYLNTETSTTQWERPPSGSGFDGTIALPDDATGLIATCQLEAIPETHSSEAAPSPPPALVASSTKVTLELSVSSLQAGIFGIDHTSVGGVAALRGAVERGVVTLVTSICQNDPDAINTPGPDGTTALMVAAAVGNVRVLDALLLAGANLDVVTPDGGASALMCAAQHGHADAVKRLLSAAANADQVDNRGATPLRIAAELGHTSVVAALLSVGAVVGVADHAGVTPVSAASERGHADIVRSLLAAEADPNAADIDGLTPLCYAAREGDLAVTELLLAASADPSIGADDGVTPVLMATQSGSLPVLRALLNTGEKCNVDVVRSGGFTPLHMAAQMGHVAVLALLVSSSASINAMADNGATALLLAAQEKHVECCELLLAAGADRGPMNTMGMTHYDLWSEEHGFYDQDDFPSEVVG